MYGRVLHSSFLRLSVDFGVSPANYFPLNSRHISDQILATPLSCGTMSRVSLSDSLFLSLSPPPPFSASLV